MESVRLICLVLFVTLSVTTAKHVYEPRIINGQDAKEGQFPHMVSLRDDMGHYCGASILSNRFLLTAAHCCHGRRAIPSYVKAVVGSYRRSIGGVVVELDKITAHEKYDYREIAASIYDVAVIRTATEITFTDLIQPIALPKANLPEDRSVKVVLSGWGSTEHPTSPTGPPDILQFSEFDAINTTDCRNWYKDIPRLQKVIQKENLCTINSKHSGACSGDSGSGLIDASDPNHKTVVGITSWVYPCARGYPDVFLRVYSRLDWIHEQIENQSGDL